MAVGDKLETVEINGNIFQATEVESSYHTRWAAEQERTNRKDKKEVIWVKLEKEESPHQAPTQKGVTILEAQESTRELQRKICWLIQEFEIDTQTVVHGINLTHSQEISGASSTYDVELDVRLN